MSGAAIQTVGGVITVLAYLQYAIGGEKAVVVPAGSQHCHCQCSCECTYPSLWLWAGCFVFLVAAAFYGHIPGWIFRRLQSGRQVLLGTVRGREEVARAIVDPPSAGEPGQPHEWVVRHRNSRR